MDAVGSAVDKAADSVLAAGGGEASLLGTVGGRSGAVAEAVGKIKSEIEEVEDFMSNVKPVSLAAPAGQPSCTTHLARSAVKSILSQTPEANNIARTAREIALEDRGVMSELEGTGNRLSGANDAAVSLAGHQGLAKGGSGVDYHSTATATSVGDNDNDDAKANKPLPQAGMDAHGGRQQLPNDRLALAQQESSSDANAHGGRTTSSNDMMNEGGGEGGSTYNTTINQKAAGIAAAIAAEMMAAAAAANNNVGDQQHGRWQD